MNSTSTTIQLPSRYYSELINYPLFESILDVDVQSQPTNEYKHLHEQVIYLLDIVAISTVLQSIDSPEDRVALLNAYPSNFQSFEFLTTYTDVEKVRALLYEKLDRALLALQ